MNTAHFIADNVYENVYLVAIDASGHSNIVESNPGDKADEAFDLFQSRVNNRLQGLRQRYRCAYAEVWSWQGDGGLLAIHDNNESVARDVAVDFSRALLQLDLRHLQDEFRQQDLDGELHIRIALHKGAIRYLGDDRRGSIHSADINFTAHLESATPSDTLAISEEVHRVCGKRAEDFEYCGSFESRKVYLWAPNSGTRSAARSWLLKQGLSRSTNLFGFYERPSQGEKARIISLADENMLDLGTALHTCSNYLMTTERPAYYRDAVLDFLSRGGKFRCYLMNADSEDARQVEERTGERLSEKIRGSLTKFEQFKRDRGKIADGLEVHQMSCYPGMAALAADLHTQEGMLLYSPYISIPYQLQQFEKGDMPHYLASPIANEKLYKSLREIIASLTSDQCAVRIL